MARTHSTTFKVPDKKSGTLHIVLYVTLDESGTILYLYGFHINEQSPTRDDTLKDFTKTRRDIW